MAQFFKSIGLVSRTVSIGAFALLGFAVATAWMSPGIAQQANETKKTDAVENKSLKTKDTTETALPKPDSYQLVSSLELVKAPDDYLTKGVEFDGVFHSFSTLGLDYPPASRDSNKFINVLVLRPDVSHHDIPLSELKLFFPRQNSDAILALESGDKVRIQGQVFSTAIGDPWVDIQNLEVLESANADKADNK